MERVERSELARLDSRRSIENSTSAATLAVAIGSGGALSKVETIPLMTVAEGVAAFKKAADASYAPPSG